MSRLTPETRRGSKSSPLKLQPNGRLEINDNFNTAHLRTHWLMWCDAMNNRTAFAKAQNEWTQMEHNMCGRRAARSPLWWWPCLCLLIRFLCDVSYGCFVQIRIPKMFLRMLLQLPTVTTPTVRQGIAKFVKYVPIYSNANRRIWANLFKNQIACLFLVNTSPLARPVISGVSVVTIDNAQSV